MLQAATFHLVTYAPPPPSQPDVSVAHTQWARVADAGLTCYWCWLHSCRICLQIRREWRQWSIVQHNSSGYNCKGQTPGRGHYHTRGQAKRNSEPTTLLNSLANSKERLTLRSMALAAKGWEVSLVLMRCLCREKAGISKIQTSRSKILCIKNGNKLACGVLALPRLFAGVCRSCMLASPLDALDAVWLA